MSRLRGRRDDDGVAAVEFALVSTVLFLLVFAALPLYQLGRTYQRTRKASTATIRYATAVHANGVRDPDTLVLSRRPSEAQVIAFARQVADDPGLDVDVAVCPSGGGPCGSEPQLARSGDRITVTITSKVDMSVIGSIANAIFTATGDDPVFPENETAITATASAREE